MQVLVDLIVEAADEGDPGDGEDDYDAGGYAADVDEFRLARVGVELFVDIHRDQCRTRVEDAGEAAHEGGEEGGYHEALEAGRQEASDEERVGVVSGDFVWPDRFGAEAGKDEDEEWEDLEGGAEEGAFAGVFDAFGRQGALDDDLVCTPVPDAEDEGADGGANPGIGGVVGGLDHVEEIWGEGGAETFEAACFVEAEEGEYDCAANEEDGLEEIRIDDSGEAAEDGVDAGGDDEEDGGGHVVPTEDFSNEDSAGEEADADFCEDVGEEGDDGEVPAAVGTEAALEEFGHRVDLALQVVRDEEPAEDEEAEAGGEFVAADGEAGGGTGAGETDEVFA